MNIHKSIIHEGGYYYENRGFVVKAVGLYNPNSSGTPILPSTADVAATAGFER